MNDTLNDTLLIKYLWVKIPFCYILWDKTYKNRKRRTKRHLIASKIENLGRNLTITHDFPFKSLSAILKEFTPTVVSTTKSLTI